MPTIDGVVLFAQEGRLHILDNDGAGHLFILGRNAAPETAQMHALQARQARVRIRYSEALDVIGRRIDAIEILPPLSAETSA